MSLVAVVCGAIGSRSLLRFNYNGDGAPGPRLVEPHMVAYTTANNLVLSAWFLGGESESQEGQGWREYLISEMTNVAVHCHNSSLEPALVTTRAAAADFVISSAGCDPSGNVGSGV